jgi:hypothetical protein
MEHYVIDFPEQPPAMQYTASVVHGLRVSYYIDGYARAVLIVPDMKRSSLDGPEVGGAEEIRVSLGAMETMLHVARFNLLVCFPNGEHELGYSYSHLNIDSKFCFRLKPTQ